MDRRSFVIGSGSGAFALLSQSALSQVLAATDVTIRSHDRGAPFEHIWNCVGSDRASISLREEWRRDIDRARQEIGVKHVRFHGILNDELGVFTRTYQDRSGQPNFKNVAAVYDGLMARGLSPIVELSFMPSELASGERNFGFYKGNVTPPKSIEAWSAFISRFVTFLVDRYGLAEVRRWPFEVWNEPNLAPFWAGSQADYFNLYKSTATAIKAVDSTLKVGGPATARVGWIAEFLAFCEANNAPLDFVSTHVYAGDNQTVLFGADRKLSVNDVVPEAVAQVRRQMGATRYAALPLYLDEWFSDSPAMIAHVLAKISGQVQLSSHWVLSGEYEELGPTPYLLGEGQMGYSMMLRGIPRANYNTYVLLNALGTERLPSQGPTIATRRKDGGISAIVWNLAEALQPNGIPGSVTERKVTGSERALRLSFPDMRPGQQLRVRFVDHVRGSPLPAWRGMGSPKIPTMAQIEALRSAARIPAAEKHRLGLDRTLTLRLPPEGVALVES